MEEIYKYIILELGNFGKSVGNLLKQRTRYRKNAEVYFVEIEGNKENIFYPEYQKRYIENIVSKNGGNINTGKFTYIVVGDLDEEYTARYAVDCAELPYLFKSIPDTVIGFFTFANSLGTTEPLPEICKLINEYYFKKLQKINHDDFFIMEKDSEKNEQYDKIDLPNGRGVFDRNYFMVAPCRTYDVINKLAEPFADRIFDEIYYFPEEFINISYKDDRSDSTENSDWNYCTFNLVKVPQIEKLCQFYLKNGMISQMLETFTKKSGIESFDFDIKRIYKLSGLTENGFINFDSIKIPILPKDSDKEYEESVDLNDYLNDRSFPEMARKYFETCLSYCCGNQFKNNALDNFRALISKIKMGMNTLLLGKKSFYDLAGNLEAYKNILLKLKKNFITWKEKFAIKAEEDGWHVVIQEQITFALNELNKPKGCMGIFFFWVKKNIKKINKSIDITLAENGLKEQMLARVYLEEFKRQEECGDENYLPNICDNFIDSIDDMIYELKKRKQVIDRKITIAKDVAKQSNVLLPFSRYQYENILENLRSKHLGIEKLGELGNDARTFYSNYAQLHGADDSNKIIRNTDSFLKGLENSIDVERFKDSIYSQLGAVDLQKFYSDISKKIKYSAVESFSDWFSKTNSRCVSLLMKPEEGYDSWLRENFDDSEFQSFCEIDEEFSYSSIIYIYEVLFFSHEKFTKFMDIFGKYGVLEYKSKYDVEVVESKENTDDFEIQEVFFADDKSSSDNGSLNENANDTGSTIDSHNQKFEKETIHVEEDGPEVKENIYSSGDCPLNSNEMDVLNHFENDDVILKLHEKFLHFEVDDAEKAKEHLADKMTIRELLLELMQKKDESGNRAALQEWANEKGLEIKEFKYEKRIVDDLLIQLEEKESEF